MITEPSTHLTLCKNGRLLAAAPAPANGVQEGTRRSGRYARLHLVTEESAKTYVEFDESDERSTDKWFMRLKRLFRLGHKRPFLHS